MIHDLVIMGIIIASCFLINHIRKYKELKFDNMILKKQVDEIRNNFKMYRNISDCENAEVEKLRDRKSTRLNSSHA